MVVQLQVDYCSVVVGQHLNMLLLVHCCHQLLLLLLLLLWKGREEVEL